MITLPKLESKSKTIFLEPGLSVEFVICSSQDLVSVIENDHYSLFEYVNPVKITCNNNRVQITKQFMTSNLQRYTIEKPLRSNIFRYIKFSFSKDWIDSHGLSKHFELNTFPSSFSYLPLFFNTESMKIFNFFTTGKAPISNTFSIKCLLLSFLNNYLNILQNHESTNNVELKLEWVTDNYLSNFEYPLPALPELCAQLNISLSKLNQVSKDKYGMSFHKYYRIQRMAKSFEWLKSKEYNVATVSKKLGYSQPIKFIQEFKRFFGETPSRYVKIMESESFF